jgi:hypothetical protein
MYGVLWTSFFESSGCWIEFSGHIVYNVYLRCNMWYISSWSMLYRCGTMIGGEHGSIWRIEHHRASHLHVGSGSGTHGHAVWRTSSMSSYLSVSSRSTPHYLMLCCIFTPLIPCIQPWTDVVLVFLFPGSFSMGQGQSNTGLPGAGGRKPDDSVCFQSL